MTAPTNITAAARAATWVEEHRADLTTAALRAGLPPRDLDSAAWLTVLDATERGGALDTRQITASAVYVLTGQPLISRPHRGRAQVVAIDAAPDLALGADPLAWLVAAEDVAELVTASRWCAGAVHEAASAPRGRTPDPDPRSERSRRRSRERERGGQLSFGGWGWQS